MHSNLLKIMLVATAVGATAFAGCRGGNPPSSPAVQVPARAVENQAARSARPGESVQSNRTVPPLEGSVEFPKSRSTQASPGEVVNLATVTFFDANTNAAVAATVTDFKGGFRLTLSGFLPELNTPYVVEAMKGLAGGTPGNDATRFRTIVKWNGAYWASISTPSIVVSSLTTAVAIEAALYPDIVIPGNTMDKVNVSVRPAGLNADPKFPDPLGNYPHPNSELLKLSTDVSALLAGDLDPVASVPEVLPTISKISTDSVKPHDVFEITGSGFSPLASGQVVTFSGIKASIAMATPTRLIVYVPDGVTSGSVVVQTNRGTAPGVGFTAVPTGPSFNITFAYPNQGTPGTDVTLLGYGFSKTPSENTVYFDTASTTCITSDITFCTCKVPAGASKGPVSVKVGDGTSNTLAFTVLTSAQISAVFPTVGAPSEEVTIDGSNMGSSGKVEISGMETRIVKWTDTQVIAEVPTGTVTGALKVTPAGRSTVTWGNFTVLAGTISGWSTITTPNPHGGGGWFARKGKYLYASGGYSPYNDKTDRMTLNLDGSPGSWTTLAGITNTRHWHGNYTGYNLSNSPSILGNFAYIYGGYDYTGGQQNSTIIQRATVFPDGSMSNFAVAPVSMATARSETQSPIRIGDWLYLIAGGNYCTDAIDAAKINPDGTLEQFNVVGRTPYSMYANTHVVVKGYVYMFGGYLCNGGGHVSPSRIWRAPLNADGSLGGTFSDVGALPIQIYDGMASIIGSNLYLFWGHACCGDGDWTNRVYKTTISPNGDLGGWSRQSDMPQAHIRGTLIKVGSRMYVSGPSGYNNSMDVATIQ